MPVDWGVMSLLWAMAAAEPRTPPPARVTRTASDAEVTLDLLEYLAGPDTAPAWLRESSPEPLPEMEPAPTPRPAPKPKERRP